jgi:predicted porin
LRARFSKRTSFYPALDHENTSGNNPAATVSGKRTNSALTAGLQMRF